MAELSPTSSYWPQSSSQSRANGRMNQFHELARALIKENTYVVVSLRSVDGQVAIAQQVVMYAGETPMHMFLKNAIQVEPRKLFEIRDTINEAISLLFPDEV